MLYLNDQYYVDLRGLFEIILPFVWQNRNALHVLTTKLADFHLMMASSSKCLPFQKCVLMKYNALDLLKGTLHEILSRWPNWKKYMAILTLKFMICRLIKMMTVSCYCWLDCPGLNYPMGTVLPEIMELLVKVKKNRRNYGDPEIIHLSSLWIVSTSKSIQVFDGGVRNY